MPQGPTLRQLVEEADRRVREEAGSKWGQRHQLWSRYDRGIRMDSEGWYTVTPESIALDQACAPPLAGRVLPSAGQNARRRVATCDDALGSR